MLRTRRIVNHAVTAWLLGFATYMSDAVKVHTAAVVPSTHPKESTAATAKPMSTASLNLAAPQPSPSHQQTGDPTAQAAALTAMAAPPASTLPSSSELLGTASTPAAAQLTKPSDVQQSVWQDAMGSTRGQAAAPPTSPTAVTEALAFIFLFSCRLLGPWAALTDQLRQQTMHINTFRP